jgi:hypothetical protein
MGNAVVDAGSRVETKNSHSSHRSDYSGSDWAELSDVNVAMRFARSGNAEVSKALVVIRPESSKPNPAFSWDHHRIPVADEHQISIVQLIDLYERYSAEKVAKMDSTERTRWLNQQGVRLAREALGTDRIPAEKGKSPKSNHRAYGMSVVRYLDGAGMFEPYYEQKFGFLLQSIANYDELRQRRDSLEKRVEATASRGVNRVFMLGASAVRSIYRLATGVVNWPVMRIYLWNINRANAVSGIDVKRARRLALGTQACVLIATTAFAVYRYHKGGAHPSTSVANAAQDHLLPQLPADPPVSSGGVLDQPPHLPPGGHEVVFSAAAHKTSQGEGWISQLSQMHIKYTPGFMNQVGPSLQSKGYAYHYFDHASGHWSWGMNLKDIDSQTLEEIYNTAKAQGLTTA